MTGDSFSFGTYNSVDDWGIMVIGYDTFLPPKRSRKISIPGRSGSYDYGAKNWDERIVRLECALMRHMKKEEFREIVYLLSKKGRLRLWNEPNKYYIAELYDSPDVIDFFGEEMREFTLSFVCEPFAYGENTTVAINDGRNYISYGGTAETPAVIVLRNISGHDISTVTVTAVALI